MARPKTRAARPGSAQFTHPIYLVTVSLLDFDGTAGESVAFFYDPDQGKGWPSGDRKVADQIFMTLGLSNLHLNLIDPVYRDDFSATYRVWALVREFDVEVQILQDRRVRHKPFQDLLPTIQPFELPCFLRDRMPMSHAIRNGEPLPVEVEA